MNDTFARATGLVLGYHRRVAVSASDFEIPARGITAVIGPNGSGKSTLLNALTGLLPHLSGQLTVLGTDPAIARTRVSYVLQTAEVPVGIPLTVRETVAMGRYPRVGLLRRLSGTDRARIESAMQDLDIADLADRHLTELSGGQRQRVLVAQGLAQDHNALILDEPLTGLDLASARAIDRLIHAERETQPVVITTHDLDEARAADHVLLLAGRVVASGPPGAALTRANLEAAYGLGALHGHASFFDDPAH